LQYLLDAWSICQLLAPYCHLALVDDSPMRSELGMDTSYFNTNGQLGGVVEPKCGVGLAAVISHLLGDDGMRARLALGALERSEVFDAPAWWKRSRSCTTRYGRDALTADTFKPREAGEVQELRPSPP
jgi:hypothetical protein